jgi:hypothetical protein
MGAWKIFREAALKIKDDSGNVLQRIRIIRRE